MSSHLACIGMAVTSPGDLDAVVAEIVRSGREPVAGAEPVTAGKHASADTSGQHITTRAWQDPSGARVVYDLVDGEPLILPTFRDAATARYTGIEADNPEVARLSVIGPDGATETGVTAELEQRRHPDSVPPEGRVSLCAMGIQVRTFPDEASFLHSDASLLGTVEEFGDPPPEVLEQGLAWPPRMSTRAFFANGYFEGPVPVSPHALISAVVRERRDLVNRFTGQSFIVAIIDTPFGTMPVCLSAVEHSTVKPGEVLTGTVSVVGSIQPSAATAQTSPADEVVQHADSDSTSEPASAPVAEPAPAIEPVPSATPAPAPIDETPLPGETRREWRRRTGRE